MRALGFGVCREEGGICPAPWPVRASAVAGPPVGSCSAHFIQPFTSISQTKDRGSEQGVSCPLRHSPSMEMTPQGTDQRQSRPCTKGQETLTSISSVASTPSVPLATSNSEIPRHCAQNIAPQSPDFIPVFPTEEKEFKSTLKRVKVASEASALGPSLPMPGARPSAETTKTKAETIPTLETPRRSWPGLVSQWPPLRMRGRCPFPIPGLARPHLGVFRTPLRNPIHQPSSPC